MHTISIQRLVVIRYISSHFKSVFELVCMCACSFTCVHAQLCSDSLQPLGLQPARVLSPQNFPGKNTGVGCHFLLHGIFLMEGSNLRLLHMHWQADYYYYYYFTTGATWKPSVQFNHSVMSNSLQLHGLKHARLPCPSPTERLSLYKYLQNTVDVSLFKSILSSYEKKWEWLNR